MPDDASLDRILSQIRQCRYCAHPPNRRPLPHEPRPVLRARREARIAVCGQAPGTRVHATGLPFNDRSGERLRSWMSVTPAEFYDESRFAIVPMGFCFPGQNAKGADLPPRPECAQLWRASLFAELDRLDLVLLVGRYAQLWHLGSNAGDSLSATVRNWRSYLERQNGPRYVPLPHPSWRNNGWLRANPWFERELVPRLRIELRRTMS